MKCKINDLIVLIVKKILLLTDPSHVQLVRSTHTSALHPLNVCPFTLVLLHFLSSASSLSLPPPSAGFLYFCSVEFQQLLQLFHSYLGIVTRKNNASPSFVCIRADVFDFLFFYNYYTGYLLFMFLEIKAKKLYLASLKIFFYNNHSWSHALA